MDAHHTPPHPRRIWWGQVRAGLEATRASGYALLAWRLFLPVAACAALWSLFGGYGWALFATAIFLVALHLAVFVHGLPAKGDQLLRERAIEEAKHLLFLFGQALCHHHKVRMALLWLEHDSHGPRVLRGIVGPGNIEDAEVPPWLLAALESIAARHHQRVHDTPVGLRGPERCSFLLEVPNVSAQFFGEGVQVGSAHARLQAVQALLDALPSTARALYTGLDLAPASS